MCGQDRLKYLTLEEWTERSNTPADIKGQSVPVKIKYQSWESPCQNGC